MASTIAKSSFGEIGAGRAELLLSILAHEDNRNDSVSLVSNVYGPRLRAAGGGFCGKWRAETDEEIPQRRVADIAEIC